MIPLPAGVRVWLATGYTDMRKGFPSLALQVQEILHRDPLGGHLFCFRGRRGNLLKVIWHDGQGACLFTKRLERGRFIWPTPVEGVMTISSAQLGYATERDSSQLPAGTNCWPGLAYEPRKQAASPDWVRCRLPMSIWLARCRKTQDC